jgi:hypothetical protein
MMKKICLFGFLVLSAQFSYADQILDLSASQIRAANAVMQSPGVAAALMQCPKERSAMAQADATITGGLEFTSWFGHAYQFNFASGENKAHLTVRMTYRAPDGKPLGQPQIECGLSDAL